MTSVEYVIYVSVLFLVTVAPANCGSHVVFTWNCLQLAGIFPVQKDNRLDMRRLGKHVHRLRYEGLETEVVQRCQITRQGGRVAGNVDQPFRRQVRQLLQHLGFCAPPAAD